MNKKEQKRAKNKKFLLGKWLIERPFLIIIAVAVIGIFFWQKFSPTPEKKFSISSNDKNDKIFIYGLEKEDLDKIDWEVGAKWTPYYLGNNNQYFFRSKEENFFWRLIKKPTNYYVITELKEHQIRNKEIEFVNISSAKEIKILKTELVLGKRQNMFAEDGWDIEKLFIYLVNFVFLLVGLYFMDRFFGTNFIGILSYPFRGWQNESKENNTITNLRFKDVGGLQEAKEELGEIISYFQNPQIFWKHGAKVPKGVLLVGPPGNGKTLLAKALAGECNLPFLFRSGSEFEEMIVGLGAQRVRELFQKARSYPQGCIIFIDEIDSIGRKRYSANNHTELTLNQLLNELDGFRPRDNIIILAATNTLNVLDSALLRPGRFDRQIYIPLPNQKGRREIIKLHEKKINLHTDFDLEETISLTKGMSGAQIVNMFNEASILSIRQGGEAINQEIIFEAYDRVLMGPSLTSHTLTPEKRKIVAYHEAGHAIIGLSLPETNVRKITIIPRWTAGGYTWIDLHGEQGDDNMLNKNQMLAQVMSFLGGRASEELIFGNEKITAGAYSDFKAASEIVRKLILHYGMSELGIIPTQESFLYGEETTSELPEKAKEKIENEREKILNKCWKRVKLILYQKKKLLTLLSEILLEKNSLRKEEIEFIFTNKISPYIPLLN